MAVLRALGDCTWMLGTAWVSKAMLFSPVLSTTASVITDRAIGTFWALSSRRRAVTTMLRSFC